MRPMKKTSASLDVGGAITVSPGRMSSELLTAQALIVHRDHHVRGFDHCIGLLADFEAKLFDRFIGNGGGHDGTPCIDADMGSRFAVRYFDDFAPQAVARADLHWALL